MFNTPRIFSSCSATLLAIVLPFLLVGCGSNQDADDTNRIVLQLNWRADAQHGGFYQALVDGEYAKEGLDIEILQGGPGTPVLPKLVMGRVDYAIANADQILQVREQDADIVGLMAPLQHSPRCIMVHESSKITKFEQLSNLTLAMNEGRTFAIHLVKNAALDGVRIVPYTGSVAKFLLDQDYAQQGYSFSEPLVAKEQGGDPHCLMLSDIGFDPYTSCVAVLRERAESNPEEVRKFIAASRRGWLNYLASAKTANEAIHRENPDMDLASLMSAAEILKDLAQPEETDESSFGWMTSDRWLELSTVMHSIDAIASEPAAAAEAAWIDLSHESESP